MSSRSIPKALQYLAVLAIVVLTVGRADAGRKRVVVLDFEGPNAEKFHSGVVKLIKKSHTVLGSDKWNAAAEELDAGKVTEKNVKKVAKKLKVDGVITGKIEKRRDEYIIKLKLRAGTTGELMGSSVQTKADGPRLDDQAKRDITDELVAVIGDLESNRGGGGGGGDDEGEDEPKKKKSDDEEIADSPKKSGFSKKKGDDDEVKAEDEPKKKKKSDDEEAAALETKSDDEDKPKKKKRGSEDEEEGAKPRKRKASRDDEEGGEVDEGIEEEAEVTDEDRVRYLSPGFRAIDAVVGLSFTARRLQFTYAPDLGRPPPGYRQSIPVAGGMFDVTVYPMAIGHKKKDITTNIGVNVLYDQVIKISSQKRYLDAMNEQRVATLATASSRFSFGAVFRYPLGKGPRAPVVGGALNYGQQKFLVQQGLPNGESTDIPNVKYSMISPSAFVRFPALPKITFNADFAFHAVTGTGDITRQTQYGPATVSGYEFDIGADYQLLPNIFARASFRYESIGLSFKGDPNSQTHMRDQDPDQDVTGAKDTYFGGTATVGYTY